MVANTQRWWIRAGGRGRTSIMILCQRWGKREWAIATAGFAIVLLAFSFIMSSDSSSSSHNFSGATTSDFVPLILLSNAVQRGAYCLDGSVPAYHFQKGFGSGSRRWVLHIEGGGWCNTIASCSFRTKTALGSSKYMEHQVQFSGILSHDPSHNPGCLKIQDKSLWIYQCLRRRIHVFSLNNMWTIPCSKKVRTDMFACKDREQTCAL